MGKEYLKKVTVESIVPSPADVILAEDFEGTMNWIRQGTNSLFIRKSPKAAFFGAYGLEISTVTVEPAAADWVGAAKYIGLMRGRYHEFAIRFLKRTYLSSGIFEAKMAFFIEGNIVYLGFRFDYSTKKWYIREAGDAWAEITALTHILDSTKWCLVRLVFDIYGKKYKYIDIGSQQANLSLVAVHAPVNPGNYLGGTLEINARNTTTQYSHAYIDEVYLRPVELA